MLLKPPIPRDPSKTRMRLLRMRSSPLRRRKILLQKALTMAASNGNAESVTKILEGKAKEYADINAPDEDGTPPLVYASCFVR